MAHFQAIYAKKDKFRFLLFIWPKKHQKHLISENEYIESRLGNLIKNGEEVPLNIVDDGGDTARRYKSAGTDSRYTLTSSISALALDMLTA